MQKVPRKSIVEKEPGSKYIQPLQNQQKLDLGDRPILAFMRAKREKHQHEQEWRDKEDKTPPTEKKAEEERRRKAELEKAIDAMHEEIIKNLMKMKQKREQQSQTRISYTRQISQLQDLQTSNGNREHCSLS